MTGTKAMWIVSVKGQKCAETFEIAVVRKDYEHGQRSYGWFGEYKLSVGHGHREPVCEFVWDRLIEIANDLCAKLNAESSGCEESQPQTRKG
jgi:hypothetical protein